MTGFFVAYCCSIAQYSKLKSNGVIMNKLLLAIAISLLSATAFAEKSYTVEQLEDMIADNKKP